MHKRKLVIAIPASVISDIPHLREKTLEIGLIGRAAAIFQVNEIVIYSDQEGGPNQKRDRGLIATLLAYMETPQYLRKRLFQLKPELKYAGILPPLRTPHHPLESQVNKLKKGEYREGVVVSVNNKGSFVDIGVENALLLPEQKLPVNRRVTVEIVQVGKTKKLALANPVNINQYWGYTVTTAKGSFGQLIKSRNYDLVVATSKMGVYFQKVADELSEKWNNSKKILVGFGAPSQGLQKIVAKEKLSLEQITDYNINTIPNQGTKTVRTEEAIYATLALLNILEK
ncbi:MAG: S1 RNA-binding domain-containing protein [Candidatus Bathyarchaeota archaeon]|nr:RNA methyltransferase [Candidatus Bathyarchaeum tardum]WGM90436.1 MAG: RNA methyltransferase [Candidatus Bathyarchaeum tardum]WNZ29494.1 MAG: S1 RNA-binding domain-containing protein [Candidatus Bathyarchaeota archaeon]